MFLCAGNPKPTYVTQGESGGGLAGVGALVGRVGEVRAGTSPGLYLRLLDALLIPKISSFDHSHQALYHIHLEILAVGKTRRDLATGASTRHASPRLISTTATAPRHRGAHPPTSTRLYVTEVDIAESPYFDETRALLSLNNQVANVTQTATKRHAARPNDLEIAWGTMVAEEKTREQRRWER